MFSDFGTSVNGQVRACLVLARLVLELSPDKIVAVKNGLEALKEFEGNKFDVVILDVMMPYVDGFEACQRIRERSDVPIVILTSRDGTEDVVHGFELGADDYITKPFKTAELIARVESILRRVEGYKHRVAPPIVRVGLPLSSRTSIRSWQAILPSASR